jgi:NADH-quinone oxidoreductase subunit N
LYASNPALVWVIAIALFSLAGVPPTAGFFGKMFLVTSGAARGNYWLVTIAALNMVISLYYYLKLVKYMFVDKPEVPIARLQASVPMRLSMWICTAGVIATGFAVGLFEYLNSIIVR